LFRPGAPGSWEKWRAHELPHHLALRRDLEDPALASLADERVAVGEPWAPEMYGLKKTRKSEGRCTPHTIALVFGSTSITREKIAG